MKDSLPLSFRYSIPTSADQISTFFQKVIQDINGYVALEEKIQSRLKLILIELCTNFIKHVSVQEGTIDIVMRESKVFITKRYKEDCFRCLLIEKTRDIAQGEIGEISFSEKNRHHVKIEKENQIKFLNPFELDLPHENLQEHYGLLILTLGADSFIYEYDGHTGEDRFRLCVIVE